MATPTQRKVIRVHRQAMGMLEIVRRHLEHFPQDGVLFLIDFERAIGDLGFDLSHGMREHLLAQFRSPVPDSGELYEAVKQGRITLPARIRLHLGPAPSEGEHTSVAPDGPGAPIMRVFPDEMEKPPQEGIAPPKPGTGGYSVLAQLTDDIVNRVVSVAYDENLIPHVWSGSHSLDWPLLRMRIEADYHVNVRKPTIDFATIFVNGVALNLNAAANLRLRFFYLELPVGVPGFTNTIEADVAVSARAVGTAEIRNVGPDKAAVYLKLADLKVIDVTIAPATLPPLVQQMIKATIERIAQTELAPISLPLSFDFECIRRAGVPIRVASRIRQPGVGNPGTLSIAIDTDPFTGDPTTIPHIVPAGNGFGFVTTKHFLIGQVWPIIRAKFPITVDDGVELRDPRLDLINNPLWFPDTYYMFFFVKAAKGMGCLGELNADVSVLFQFEALPPQNGVHRTRLQVVGKDVSLDLWDRLFFTILLGLILAPFGLGVIGMIAFNVLIAILEGKVETDLGNTIQASSVGFRDKIPGTNIVVEASTPIAPTIYNDLIFGYGDAVFYPEH